MATQYSTQRTNDTATPPTAVAGRDVGGRVRCAWFDYTAPSSGAIPAIGDNVQLCKLPNGARILRGYIWWTTGTTSMTGSIGYTGATTRYLAATAMVTASTAALPFADTVALKQGEVMTADRVIILTVAGAQIANSQVLQGFIEYTID